MTSSYIDSLASTSSMPYSVSSPNLNETNSTMSTVNEVEVDKPPYSIFEMILIGIMAGLLSIVTVIGNIMVMISFKMDKQLQTISNYFLLSLAVADFSIGLISMPLSTMYLLIGSWPLGDFVCDSWLAFDYLNSNASVLNLLIISFDRYFSVTRPLTYRALRTTRRAAFMIASAWVISLMLWPPWIYAWPYIEGRRTVKKNQCYIQFLETNSYVTFGTALAAFYVPVTVMCFLYWRIWRETKQRQKDLTHLQAGKKEDSRKSTSSDDPPEHEETTRKQEAGKRFRTDSCILDDAQETTYVPTSLCVETSKYLPKKKESKRLKITELLRTWCRIDKEGDPQEEESTSHESPVTTPASLETPMQTCSRTASMSFRIDHRTLQPQSFATPSTSSHKTNDQSIPMTERNGQKRFDTNIPEWKRQVTSLMPKPVTAAVVPKTVAPPTANTATLAMRPRIPAAASIPSQSQMSSPDSVYTILIRLPPKSASIEGEGESQASIKMIMEDDEVNTDAIETLPEGESADNKSSLETADCLLRAADSAVDAIRLPLNTKLVHKQVAKHRAPKKKRKQQERKQEMKAAKTLSAILFAFTVTWTPYNVLVLYKTLSNCKDDDCIPPGLWNFAYYLCYINSTVNPFCYALCNANFRRTYTRILTCKWHNKRKTLDSRGFFT